MKHPRVLVIATAFAAVVFVVQASAASARTGLPAHGTIGKAAPSPTAAAALRALGLDDEGGSDDGGGLRRRSGRPRHHRRRTPGRKRPRTDPCAWSRRRERLGRRRPSRRRPRRPRHDRQRPPRREGCRRHPLPRPRRLMRGRRGSLERHGRRARMATSSAISPAALAGSVPSHAGDRRSHWVAVALGVFAVGNAAGIVWFWGSGGADGLGYHWHSFGAALIGLGRLTALLAGYLALIEVLLLARLPFLERAVGLDRLTVWHRRNGYAVHRPRARARRLLGLGLRAAGRHSFLREYWNWLTLPQPKAPGPSARLWRAPALSISRPTSPYPGIITATVGTALLLAVVVSSIVVVRRTLSYEWWYAVHFTVYAAIALVVVPHDPRRQRVRHRPHRSRLLAKPLRADPRARALLPGRAAARAGRPLRSAGHRGHARGAGCRLAPHRRARPRAARRRGGPVLLLALPHRGLLVRRSIRSRSPRPRTGDSFRITVKALGDHSAQARRDPGRHPRVRGGPVRGLHRERRADVEGAPDRGRDRDHAGAGAPRADGRRASSCSTASSRAARSCSATSSTGSPPRAERASSTSIGDHRDPGGPRPALAAPSRGLVPDISERDVYVCGPPGMVDRIVPDLRAAGVPRRQLHVERFAL